MALLGGGKSQTTISTVSSTDNRAVLAEGAQMASGGSSIAVSSAVTNYIGTMNGGGIGLDGWAGVTNHVDAAAKATGHDSPPVSPMTLILAGAVALLLIRGRRGQ